MSKRFVRHNLGKIEQVKESYRRFVLNSLDLLSGEEENDEKEKTILIKKEYEQIISSETIERNELLLNVLNQEMYEVFQSRKQRRIEKYVDLINILRRSKIISHMDATDLKDFQDQSYQKEDVFGSETPRLRVLTREDFKMYFASFEELYDGVNTRLETKMSLNNKNKAFGIVDRIIAGVNFKKLHSDLEIRRVYYGSTVSHLSTSNSDIDITLMTNINCDERELLNFLWKEIQEKSLLADYEHNFTPLLHSAIRVPILDIELLEFGNVKISFSANNKLAALNSRLLELYSNLDPRCQMLALLIKIWSKTHKICSAREGYLSSYAYNLMVINFLQIHKPPILPSLEFLRAEVEPLFLEITSTSKMIYSVQVNFENNIARIQDKMARIFGRNERTLENLLLRFFKFYKNEKYLENKVISIKEGKLLRRDSLDIDEKYLYSIEDPFEKYQNPGRYVSRDSTQAKRILAAMEKSYKLLKVGKFVEIFQSFQEEGNIIFS